MRRLGVWVLLLLASGAASLPAIGAWCWRQRTAEAWEILLIDMRDFQSKRERSSQVAIKNARLKAAHKQASFPNWIAQGENLVFLNKERDALAKLPATAWVVRSRAVKDRKAFLEDNRLSWQEQTLGEKSTLFSFQKELQIDDEDIPVLLGLFDPKYTQIPIVFLSYWEMTKQVSSLGNEVWVVHAEAWGRCV
ncbi:hypothetical protein SOTONIA1_00688 [Chlamydia trachomatis Ia/SotonIa1]|uniref:hypothetical protein n=1 Tax=Chlamydia trachomatis TaxID=813 RepID=UPI0002A819F6|nr:hypothetical protein [Chlamydia trachomatis]CCP59119.1 hypothetical protein SOTONIA1_00688 [Chlamydia trachomatis Ia/SotonIa1]CCP60013.1 hypothetical protein SOTONIA3_00688 [Chlamydia trachomatis Ia/SotonIa3]